MLFNLTEKSLSIRLDEAFSHWVRRLLIFTVITALLFSLVVFLSFYFLEFSWFICFSVPIGFGVVFHYILMMHIVPTSASVRDNKNLMLYISKHPEGFLGANFSRIYLLCADGSKVEIKGWVLFIWCSELMPYLLVKVSGKEDTEAVIHDLVDSKAIKEWYTRKRELAAIAVTLSKRGEALCLREDQLQVREDLILQTLDAQESSVPYEIQAVKLEVTPESSEVPEVDKETFQDLQALKDELEARLVDVTAAEELVISQMDALTFREAQLEQREEDALIGVK
jgi:hypothetical protein